MALSVQVNKYTAPEAVDGKGVGVQSLPVNDGETNLRLVQLAPRIAAYRVAMRCAPCAVGAQALLGLATQATWDVSAAPDSPASETAAEVVRRTLGLGGYASPVIEWDGRVLSLPSWETRMRQLLTGALYGFALAEMVAYPYEGTTYIDLEPRDQSSVRQWVYEGRRIVAVDQWQREPYGLSSVGSVRIPYERLVHLVWPSLSEGVEGVGLLRQVEPLASDYRRATNLRNVLVQRYAVPVPTVTIDEDALARQRGTAPSQQEYEAARDELLRVLRRYTSHEESALVLPSWASLSFEGAAAASGSGPLSAVVSDIEREILQAFYVQFLAMGSSGSSGAYATAQVHAELAAQMAGDLCQWLAEGLSSYVRAIVNANIGPMPLDQLPRLTYSGIRSSLWVEKVGDVVSLLSAGVLTPTAEDERAIRSALELPAPTRAAEVRSERERLGRTVRPTTTPSTLPGGI